MECKIRYSPDVLLGFNKKNVCPIDPALLTFFQKFQKTRYSNVPYHNPFNQNFPNQQRKKLFPTHEPFSDDKILADFKACLTKLTAENKDEIAEQLMKMRFPKGSEEKASAIFHETTLSCIFLVDVYVDVLLKLEPYCKEIVLGVNKIISEQLYHPREFSTENDDIACETAEQKAKKWRINNGLLIAELFKRSKYHHQFLVNNILIPIVNHITVEDTINIEVLNKIMPIIGPKLEQDHNVSLSGFFYQLDKISKDKAYPARLRYLLMDIIDLHKKGWTKK